MPIAVRMMYVLPSNSTNSPAIETDLSFVSSVIGAVWADAASAAAHRPVLANRVFSVLLCISRTSTELNAAKKVGAPALTKPV